MTVHSAGTMPAVRTPFPHTTSTRAATLAERPAARPLTAAAPFTPVATGNAKPLPVRFADAPARGAKAAPEEPVRRSQTRGGRHSSPVVGRLVAVLPAHN